MSANYIAINNGHELAAQLLIHGWYQDRIMRFKFSKNNHVIYIDSHKFEYRSNDERVTYTCYFDNLSMDIDGKMELKPSCLFMEI